MRKVAIDAYDNQDVPFEQLVNSIQPERNMASTPLFQVMFTLENKPVNNLVLPDLTLKVIENGEVAAKFDLTLSMKESSGGLIGALEYNTDLFNQSRISSMAKHFQCLVEDVVSNPEKMLSELSIITSEEKDLFVDWNNTLSDYDRDKCIHEIFEEQSALTPDADAVVFGDKNPYIQ